MEDTTGTRVLVAGCGDVGQELARRLAARGYRVWGLRRSAGALPAGVETIRADLTQPDTLAALPAGLDVVVYAASADARDEEAYRRAYVDGPSNLIVALKGQDQSPRRFVFTSSTGVYHQTGGEWVDESSPTRPREATGRRLLEGEQVVLDGPFAAAVVRFGGIYGPGRTWLLERVAQGRVSLSPDGATRYTNRIHRDDCAEVLRHLIELPAVERLYLAVDDEPAPLREVVAFLAERMGVDLFAGDSASMPSRRRSNKRCANARLRATGYRFAYPSFREGYAPLIEQWLANRPA